MDFYSLWFPSRYPFQQDRKRSCYFDLARIVNPTLKVQYIPRVPHYLSPLWNWERPTPSPASECETPPPPPPPRTKSGEHARLRLRGWGSPSSDDCPSLATVLPGKHAWACWRFHCKSCLDWWSSCEESLNPSLGLIKMRNKFWKIDTK